MPHGKGTIEQTNANGTKWNWRKYMRRKWPYIIQERPPSTGHNINLSMYDQRGIDLGATEQATIHRPT